MRPGNLGVVAGRRYYSPGLGRWSSRDPIGEMGGPNLLAMCANSTGGVVDARGLTPQADHAHCENQRLNYEERLRNPQSGISGFWASITRGLKDCPLPRIECKCCDVAGLGGEFDPGEQTGAISICENSLSGPRGWTDFGNRLKHELVHAAQACHGFRGQSCVDSVCREIQAYYLDGVHQTPEQVLLGVEFSALPACIRDVVPTWDPAKTSVDEVRTGPDGEAIRKRVKDVFTAVYQQCAGAVRRPPGLPNALPPSSPPGLLR